MRNALLLCLLGFLYSCSPISRSALRKTFTKSEAQFHDHIGFALYDLDTRKTTFEYQSDRYFTPASNTKIFTLFASLKILGDSIPGLYYSDAGDSLIVWGSGDPGFLYKNVFNNGRTFEFLRSTNKPLYLSASNFYTQHFGPGWAWDDYNSSYSPERSSFPLYGNIISVEAVDQRLKTTPPSFQRFMKPGSAQEDAGIIRERESNSFVYHPAKARTKYKDDFPFKTDSLFTTSLLSDTLRVPVRYIRKPMPKSRKTFNSVPADSLYKVLMQQSDNFIAEQLLLVCASVLSDSLKPEITINYVKKNFLSDLKDEPVWVDGSGLSRYNLFTPRSVVQLWEKIYALVPRERLFPLLATGGKTGTLKNSYKAAQPYIFGKTGTLSNNHCLSGYLVTKKGKTFIFSFMNSNFTRPGSEVRKNMQEILKTIYEKY